MFKFTNGIVVFDEKTKNEFIKAGLKLVSEVKNENNNNDGIIPKKSKGSKRKNSKV